MIESLDFASLLAFYYQRTIIEVIVFLRIPKGSSQVFEYLALGVLRNKVESGKVAHRVEIQSHRKNPGENFGNRLPGRTA